MKNLLLALLVIVLAGSGTVFFAAGGRDDVTAPASGASPLDADYDYYIANMRATRFGADGQAVSQLQAERVTHYPDGLADLQTPQFRTFGAAGDPWQVAAATGTLAPDAEQAGDRLDLAGEVELHKPLDNGNFVDISTNELTVYIDTEEATSTAPVTIQTRDTRLEGVGMRALLAQDYLRLNNGSGSHEPNL